MSKKLAVIISSIAAAVVAVVGVVFAGVWGTINKEVPDNTITVGDGATVVLSGDAIGGTIVPGTPIAETFTVKVDGKGADALKTYNLVLTVTGDEITGDSTKQFQVAVDSGAATDVTTGMVLVEGLTKADCASGKAVTLTFTLKDDDASFALQGKDLVFTLALVDANA